MPKRSLDLGSTNMEISDKVQRKTERSHEENQERAYIAASRRADRSIDARVQSARMASEIHKKRTGKSFRITEEIVRKEEMYEEEEEDLPRSYRLLGPHMQTASPEMNKRVEAYLSNRIAMSAYMNKMNDEWRENHINQLFAQSFPNIGQQARRLSHSITSPTGQHNPQPGQPAGMQSPAPPTLATFSAPNYQQDASRTQRGSISTASPTTHSSGQSAAPVSMASPSSLSPLSSHTTHTVDTHSKNMFEAPVSPPGDEFDPSGSVFTTEFPPEMKLIMGGGVSGMDGGQLSNGFVDTTFMGVPSSDGFYHDNTLVDSGASKMSAFDDGQYGLFDNRDDTLVSPVGAGEEPSWDSFIHNSAWDTADQQ